MATAYLSEVRIFGFNFAPKGWALCNGQLLPINQNQALFSLLGTSYGGNGTQTFALPNLQGRVPMHMGNSFTIGALGGEANHTLTVSEIPSHTHTPVGSSLPQNTGTVADSFWPNQVTANPYATSGTTPMAASAISNNAGGQPHNNMQPYLTVNYCICLSGIFPSRN